MVYKEVSYSLKVWLSTIAAAPVICLIVIAALSGLALEEPASDWYVYIFYYLAFVTVSGFFSLVLFAVFLMIVNITVSYSGSILLCKSIISCSGFLLSVVTLCALAYLVAEDFSTDILYMAVCYGVCAAWFSWFYELTEPSSNIETSTLTISN